MTGKAILMAIAINYKWYYNIRVHGYHVIVPTFIWIGTIDDIDDVTKAQTMP